MPSRRDGTAPRAAAATARARGPAAAPGAGDDAPLRVGLLVPSSNSVLEPALWRRLPTWATLHAARLFVTESTAAGVQGIHDAIPEAARLVGTVRPHLIAIGCTSVSGVDDGVLETRMAPAIEAATGARVVTVLPAVVAALRAAGCRRVVLVTPHGAEVDAVVVRGLAAAGIGVREIHSMGIGDNFALGRVPPAAIVRFVAERVRASLGDDALFLSCTNFRSVEVLPALRRRYGPRVWSSVGALIERVLAELSRLRQASAAGGARPRERGRHGA
jgi:maleate isomerase